MEKDTKKPVCITLTSATHLKLKVQATCVQKTMGEYIAFLLNRVETDKNYTVEDDLKLLRFQEDRAAEEADAIPMGELKIQEAS